MKSLILFGVLCFYSRTYRAFAGEIDELCYSQRGLTGVCSKISECGGQEIWNRLASYTICKWYPSILVCCTGRSIKKGSRRGRAKSVVLSSLQNAPSIAQNYQKCGNGYKPTFVNIVNGVEAKEAAWPWMAAIFRKAGRRFVFLCGGTIINDKYVLTAAHCFKGKSRNLASSPQRFEIRLGEHDLSDRYLGERHKIEDILIHEDYNPPAQYKDIALLRVKRSIEFTQSVSPICLPTAENRGRNLAGKMTYVIGWGDTFYGGRASTVLQQVAVPITEKGYCNSVYKARGHDPKYPRGLADPSIICAGYREGGKDACLGDSGGPLMDYKKGIWTLVGIVSGGHQCARPDAPGLYTDVSHFVDWLNYNIY